jgi:two-component system sporulation sensor kinase A
MGAKMRTNSSHFDNPDAIFSIDLHGRFTSVNASGEEFLGYKLDELLQMTVWDVLPEQTLQLDQKWLQSMADRVCQHHHQFFCHKQGATLEVRVTSFPIIHDGQVVGRFCIAKDVTSQRQMEETLRKTQEIFELISKNVLDLIRIVDTNGIITYASPSHQTTLGIDPEQVLNQPCFSLLHPDERERAHADFHQMIRSKKPSEFEYYYLHKDGRALLFEIKGRPVLGPNGEVENVVVVGRDITERRKAEDLLRNSDKLSMLGELAAGIAHEIRNPLTALKGFIQLLQAEGTANEQYLQIMLSEIDRITFITNELLLLAKPQAHRYREHALLPLLQNVIKLLEPQANLKNVRIRTVFPVETPIITCEEYQIKQVFINLIKNGMEAMPFGGDLTIEVQADFSFVRIRFVDQGKGIPPEVIAKLGEPFFSTKDQGTGLGLMVSYKIIRDHHGDICISSEIGTGTTVDVWLPLSTSA